MIDPLKGEPAMRWLTEDQIAEVAAESLAAEIADEANALQRRARNLGLLLEIRNVADEFGVVIVRARNHYAKAMQPVVPA